MHRRVTIALAGLTSLAVALRALHLHAMADVLLEMPPEAGMDRWLAMHVAGAVGAGDWLGGWSADYDSGPAYAYWLGLLYRLGGQRWIVPLAVHILLGAAVCPLVYVVGRRLFSPAVGLLAAAMAALYAPAVFYETLLVKFSLVSFTVAVLLVCLVHSDGPDARWALGAGCAFGALVALRANAALVGPVLAWWIVRPAQGVRQGAARLALLALGTVLVLGPFLLRDRVVMARGGGASLWGIHFYIATHAEADGTYSPVDGVRDDAVGHVVDARRVAEQGTGRRLTPAEVSWYWFSRGLSAIRENPWRYALLEARKLRLVLAGFEEGSFGDTYEDAVEESWVLRLPLLTFGSICPLALLGMALALQRREGEILVWVIGAYVLSLLPFFIAGRYRLPIAVPMLLLAARGLVWVTDAVRRRRWDMLALAGILMAVLVAGLPAEAADRWKFAAVLGTGVVAAALARRQEPRSAT